MQHDLMDGDENSILLFIKRCLKSQLGTPFLSDPLTDDSLSSFRWDGFIAIAQQEHVAPILYTILRQYSWVPEIINRQLYQAYRDNSIRNTVLYTELKKIICILQTEEIAHILLKGSGLAPIIYNDIGQRPMADIDLLVKKEDIYRLIRCLSPHGYSLTQADSHINHLLRFENEIVLTKPGLVNVFLEAHWTIFDSPYYQAIIPPTWLWQSAIKYRFEDQEILLLGHHAQILHLCGHLYLHHTGNEVLWQFDLAAWVDKFNAQISWDELLSFAQKFKLVQPIKFLIPKISKDYGVSISPDILIKIENLVVSISEQRLIQDLKTGEQSVVKHFWIDIKVIKGWKSKLIFIWQNLFPSVDYMRYRYNIEHVYLLPLFYPYRWAIGIKEIFHFRQKRN